MQLHKCLLIFKKYLCSLVSQMSVQTVEHSFTNNFDMPKFKNFNSSVIV